MPVTPTLVRPRQEDFKSEASLAYSESLLLWLTPVHPFKEPKLLPLSSSPSLALGECWVPGRTAASGWSSAAALSRMLYEFHISCCHLLPVTGSVPSQTDSAMLLVSRSLYRSRAGPL